MIPLRDENPSGSLPAVTITLIAACTGIFLYEVSLGQGIEVLFHEFALIPGRVTYSLVSGEVGIGGILPPFFTSMFLHGGWLHLIGNMWYLWIFGDNVEDALGSFRYLLFYLATGLAAGLTHYALDPASPIPTVGASGAIAGVLGAYMVRFPGARVTALVPLGFFVRVMELPAAFLIGLWFLAQLASGLLTLGVQGGGVAWWAHVGGFLAGVLLIQIMRRRRVVF